MFDQFQKFMTPHPHRHPPGHSPYEENLWKTNSLDQMGKKNYFNERRKVEKPENPIIENW